MGAACKQNNILVLHHDDSLAIITSLDQAAACLKQEGISFTFTSVLLTIPLAV
jgi:hypothetical protein